MDIKIILVIHFIKNKIVSCMLIFLFPKAPFPISHALMFNGRAYPEPDPATTMFGASASQIPHRVKHVMSTRQLA